MIATEITNCRLCQSDKLDDLFDLGDHALSGCFPNASEQDAPVAPLKLCKCATCHLVQLCYSVNLDEMFTSSYGYRSSLNASMAKHLQELVNWTLGKCEATNGDLVLDIGANDGTLLKSYPVSGLKKVGIDPIISKFQDYYTDSTICYEDFFSCEKAKKLFKKGEIKIITSISMFYDLPDPSDFVAGIAWSLSKNGIWVLEQSYLPSMLESNSFDTICHEHLEYYALEQIQILAEQHGLEIIDVQLNDCNGGSFRVAVAHKNHPHQTNQSNINALRAAEQKLQLHELQTYDKFINRVDLLGQKLLSFLVNAKKSGQSIYIYGASTKGNTLLQHYGIGADLIDGALEVNKDKFGARTPGTNIPILDEKEIFKLNPDYLLVLPWHFRDDILQRSKNYIDAGIAFIFPLPEFDIVAHTQR